MRSVIFCLFAMLYFPAAVLAQDNQNPVDNAPRDVLLVLDNSGSMKQNDPARLTVQAVRGFIDRQTPGTRVGILLFADNPRLVMPLTPVGELDSSNVTAALEQLNYSGRWTETAEAVERGIYALRLNGRENALQAMVLMTDGILDTGNAGRDQLRMEWLRNSLVAEAREQGIAIFGLAFTEKADFQLLQYLAQQTGAAYFRALTPDDLSPVLSRIDVALAQSAQAASAPPPTEPAAMATPPAEGQTVINTTEPDRAQSSRPQINQGQADQPLAAPVTAPERIVYSGPAVTNPPATQAAPVSGNSHLVLWVLLAVLVSLFLLAGAGWWVLAYWRKSKGKPSAAAPDHGPQAVLYDVNDPSDIKRHEMADRPVVIGRVEGTDPSMSYLVVEERTIGRWHATIERRGQSFWVRDEGSVNGTYVNDTRVVTEHPLKHGDMLRVHKHEFEFVIPELFDSDRTLMADERTKARAIQTARPTTTSRPHTTARSG